MNISSLKRLSFFASGYDANIGFLFQPLHNQGYYIHAAVSDTKLLEDRPGLRLGSSSVFAAVECLQYGRDVRSESFVELLESLFPRGNAHVVDEVHAI